MSQESAKKFIEKCQNDPSFKQKIESAKNEKETKALLKDNGFSFTKDEYKSAAKAILGKECSDKELMQIVGGAVSELFSK